MSKRGGSICTVRRAHSRIDSTIFRVKGIASLEGALYRLLGGHNRGSVEPMNPSSFSGKLAGLVMARDLCSRRGRIYGGSQLREELP
jgi:hypothetical protein